MRKMAFGYRLKSRRAGRPGSARCAAARIKPELRGGYGGSLHYGSDRAVLHVFTAAPQSFFTAQSTFSSILLVDEPQCRLFRQ